jgi:hypothetical protein
MEVINMQNKLRSDVNIIQYKTDMIFKTLMDYIKDKIIIIPNSINNQNNIQTGDLIFSLIKNFPIPTIYTYRNKNGELILLNEIEKITNMINYYNNNEKCIIETYNIIDGVETKKELNIAYNNLPIQIKKILNNRIISMVEIYIENDNIEIKNEILEKIKNDLNK